MHHGEFQHVEPGKGAAFSTKYKNVMTGAIREESFNPTAKFEQATVERKMPSIASQRRRPRAWI